MGGVDLPPQQLVERRVASQDNRLIRSLDAPPAEARQVGADADRTAADERDGKS